MGEKVFGVTPFGWRFSSALAGTLIVTMVAIMAQLLFGGALWTFVAGMLLAVESLNVVLSRSALLDIHLEFWVLAGFLFLLLDRRWIDGEPRRIRSSSEPTTARTAPSDLERPSPPRRAAVAFPSGGRGASPPASRSARVSVKWSGAMAILGAVILSFAWETSRRRGDVSPDGAFGRAVLRESLGPFSRSRSCRSPSTSRPAVVPSLRVEPGGLVA